MSPKARPVSNLSTAKEASSFIKHAELCYCFWHHHIGQNNSFRLKKILSCFLHFLYFLMEHAVANKHFKQNFFFLIKSNSETQQNHEPEWTQPILSTALNSIYHLNFLIFISRSLQLLHVSSQSFEAEGGFYQAVTISIILHFKFLDFAICRVLVCRWVRW